MLRPFHWLAQHIRWFFFPPANHAICFVDFLVSFACRWSFFSLQARACIFFTSFLRVIFIFSIQNLFISLRPHFSSRLHSIFQYLFRSNIFFFGFFFVGVLLALRISTQSSERNHLHSVKAAVISLSLRSINLLLQWLLTFEIYEIIELKRKNTNWYLIADAWKTQAHSKVDDGKNKLISHSDFT